MRNQNGITLTSLVIYVIVMLLVIGIISSITNQFSENMKSIQADTKDILEFNKFNEYFLKEVKLKDNKVEEITDNYILFASGNSFSIIDNKIYYNNIEICKGVQEMKITLGKEGNGENEDIIFVNLVFNNFTKSMNYVIEEIY